MNNTSNNPPKTLSVQVSLMGFTQPRLLKKILKTKNTIANPNTVTPRTSHKIILEEGLTISSAGLGWLLGSTALFPGSDLVALLP